MNKIIFSVLLLSSSVTVFAQDRRSCNDLPDQAARNECFREQAASQTGQQQGQGQQNLSASNAPFTECQQVFNSPRATTLVAAAVITPVTPPVPQVQYFTPEAPTGTPVIATAPGGGYLTQINPELVKCRGFENISTELGNASLRDTDSKTSNDGKITCLKKSGLTADWASCVSALGMYNNIVLAEAAMQIFQGVQTNRVQGQIQNDVSQRVSAGDAQNAAYDAQVTTMRSAKALNEQQSMAYASAVAALYSKIQSWIKESAEAVSQKACGMPTAPPAPAEVAGALPIVYASQEAIPPQTGVACVPHAIAAVKSHPGIVFANRQAKGEFTTAAMLFAGKAIAAGIKASQLGAIANRVEEAKNATEDPYNPATFDVCQVNMADPRCAQAGNRTGGSGLQDGGFSFGEGFGNNAFTPIGESEDLTSTDPLPLPGDQVVGDTTNPFVDDAKKASGILDPAGAASIQPGAAAGGGGGGGAGSPGGGSASLGNDTPGADDSKKENDIKANKADGKYGQFAGGGFQAIKPMKDDNPFANLFDGKGGGKLEEDRSIASGDIDGRDSGIFSKISKRYGQVQADKRIEAKNIEE